MTNSIYHFLLTQGVDSTSVNRISLESTKHQRKRTPPTLWCRKFISAYHYRDRLRITYTSPGWTVRRAAHCGAAFLRDDTASEVINVTVDSPLVTPKVQENSLSSALQWATAYCTDTLCILLH